MLRKLVTVSAFSLFALTALAAEPTTRPSAEVLTDPKGIAVSGYDVVSYFDGKPLAGKAAFSTTHLGATFRFATEENLAKFKADPDKFVPQYGGFCAYGLAEGHKAPTDPLAFSVVNGKLYLNYNKKVSEMWTKNMDAQIKKADEKWPSIREEPSPQTKAVDK